MKVINEYCNTGISIGFYGSLYGSLWSAAPPCFTTCLIFHYIKDTSSIPQEMYKPGTDAKHILFPIMQNHQGSDSGLLIGLKTIISVCQFPALVCFSCFFYEGRGGGLKSIAVMGMLECLLSVGKHSMSLFTKLCHWPDSPSLVLFTVNPVLQHPTVFQCGLLCVCIYLQSAQMRLMINY